MAWDPDRYLAFADLRLRPLLAALDEPRRGEYAAEYAARVRAAYPKLADGHTLFPFRRLFLIAVA